MIEKIKIIEYFDAVINEVDISAEILILNETCEKIIEKANSTRKKFIDIIKSIQDFNLECLNSKQIYDPENDRLLFKKYCFLLDVNLSKNAGEKSLGVLIVINGYINHDLIKYLKYFSLIYCSN